MTDTVGIGVIGARSVVATRAVLPAIDESERAHVAAVASNSGAVDERWRHVAVDDYEAVLQHPGVDAVYIPLPNGLHRRWTERAAAAGKHVLCEKPLAPDAETARRMAVVCGDAGVLLAEAYMTPFHRRYAHLLRMVADGAVGQVEHVDARFTFTIGPDAAENYRWDPEQGGGALLDVGIYCLGPIVETFGADPQHIDGGTTTSATGVDAETHAVLTWPGRRHASIHCSFVDDEQQSLTIRGTNATVKLDNQAYTGGDDDDPYLGMVDAFADAVRGRAEWPRPVERSIEMLELIGRIRGATR